MKDSFDDLPRSTLIAMIQELFELLEDHQTFLNSVEKKIKQFRRRPPRDLLGDEPRRPRRS